MGYVYMVFLLRFGSFRGIGISLDTHDWDTYMNYDDRVAEWNVRSTVVPP